MLATNWLSASRRMAVGLTAGAVVVAVSGCGVGTTAPASGVAPVAGTLQVSGKAIGGQQALYNTTIQLWSAGMTGTYGTGATPLISASVKTAADGSFSITGDYTCATPDPQVYLTATGGNPSGDGTTTTNNSNIQLVAALGSCATLKTNAATTLVQINEVTTAAAAFALAQFYGGYGTATDQIGAPATNVAGLTNAFATAHNLASVAAGLATPTAAASGTNYYLSQNDNAKINTIANVLADCVNQTTSNSAVCGSLFAYVTPKYAPLSTTVTATAPVNTFQAAVYMNLNPLSVDSTGTSNLTNLFNLQSAFASFAPTLSGAPTDWTLAVNYTGTGINLNSGVAIDSNGDVWLSNANTVGGAVMLNGGTGTAGGTAGVAGGVIGYFTAPSAYPSVNGSGARSITVDQNDKAWWGSFGQTATTPNANGYYLFRGSATGSVEAYFNIPTGTTQPYAVVADPTGRVFSTTTSTSVMYTSATSATNTNMTIKGTVAGSNGNTNMSMTTADIAYIPATNGNLYTLNTSTLATATIAAATTGFNTPYGSATDASSRLWVTNNPSSAFFLTLYDPAANSGAGTFTQITNSCLQKPGFIAIDGNNNAWVTNQSVATGTDYGVCEFNSSGTLISNTIGFHLHAMQSSRSIAVDRSGNVWVSNYSSAASDSVTQIVGAAAPAVTPLSLAIKNGTVGTRP